MHPIVQNHPLPSFTIQRQGKRTVHLNLPTWRKMRAAITYIELPAQTNAVEKRNKVAVIPGISNAESPCSTREFCLIVTA